MTNQTIPAWTKEMPDFACVFVCRTKYRDRWEYNLFILDWEVGETPEGGDEDTTYYYLALMDKDGEGWGDKDELSADEFKVIEILPTLDRINERKQQ